MGGEEEIHTIVRKNLKEDNPDVYNILNNFSWTQEDMEEVMLNISNGMSPEDAAQQWIDDNQDTVNSWLSN